MPIQFNPTITAIFIGALLAGVQMKFPNQQWVGFVLIVVSFFGLMLFGVKRERRSMSVIGIIPILWIVLGISILIVGTLVISHGINIAWPTAKKTPTSDSSQVPAKIPTLRDLFKIDFNNLLRTSIEITAIVKMDKKETTIIYIAQEYLDFLGKSKFLGFYIPLSPDSYDLCQFLVNGYQSIMKKLELGLEGSGGGNVMDSAQTKIDDLIFSGRIYIYHEDTFSLQQLAALEHLYQSKGLSVIFRGSQYHSLYWHNTTNPKND